MNSTDAQSPRTRQSARETLALNLIAFRTLRGLSQEGLAFEAGLHRTFIAHIERQARNASIDNIEKIADALGVEPYVLLAPHLRPSKS
ncbi:helix-turn-helix transcriptional regulator [Pelomonas sp. V22]|uniref:helix-turn-helix domain-containing protein n=1 Tax=Pelomonas sp. V22 TaxID=2822139 RepID=UPI0024A85858|nr:helix-turn-helix transcriptional regulator [Pelomonas sp. V22]MDI4635891.1 helix-turn-helix transcriptional regulator [Pelomonas sp. V22]